MWCVDFYNGEEVRVTLSLIFGLRLDEFLPMVCHDLFS